MRVLEVTQTVSRLGGGLFEGVRHLAQSIENCSGARVTVSALEDSHTAEDIRQWAPLPVRAHRVIGPGSFGFSPGIMGDLADDTADLVHLHGLWKFASLAVWLWAKRSGKPYIISPHGMLEPWSLKQGRLRKQLALSLYQRRCLKDAACIRATSPMEATSIRQAGCTAPIALVPNGVVLSKELPSPPRTDLGRLRRALFLSRLHPKKGLLNLVEAWDKVRPAGWELLIVGPDECEHRASVEKAVLARGLRHCISFQGEVWGEERMKLYLGSDLFVLPSFSENFGLAIAEALGCGVPVITTRATPWKEIETHGCGWWIETGVEPLVRALSEAVSLPPERLQEMGGCGRVLIERNYDWRRIGRTMAEVYEWLLGRRARPGCVSYT